LGVDVAVGSLVRSQRGEVPAGQNLYTPDDAALEETRRAIEAYGVRALAMPLDVCSDDSVRASFEAILAAFGKIDILINAAGSSTRHPIIDHPDSHWYRMLEVNLTGPYRTIRLCFPGMKERRWGRIVNFASTAANVGYPNHSAYCASKSGLLGLTRCVALEGAAFGISCNAICPGFVETGSNYGGTILDMQIAGVDTSVEAYRAQIAESLPQKRYLQPEEVGALAAFLCRDDAWGVTAESITIAMGSLW
jgi:NAD(P)-dependent dehydrogenase (short-subunit alcohol dehydrogenase family)